MYTLADNIGGLGLWGQVKSRVRTEDTYWRIILDMIRKVRARVGGMGR